MNEVAIKIVNRSDNPMPEYATAGSAGMDIRANLDGLLTLLPMQRQMVPTGLFLEIPEGYEAQVRPRSGLADKKGITCLNSPGTVDSDYRGEIKVVLINLSGSEQVIQHGDRIAQMVFAKVERARIEPVEQLTETQRGSGGFGHTGFN